MGTSIVDGHCTLMVSRLIDGIRDYVSPQTPPLDGGGCADGNATSTSLFTCHSCGETYISEEMDDCPRCSEPVERTPSFDDLGIRTGRGR